MSQTMTPEERAAALVASIMEHLFVDGETVSVDVMNPASDLIIAAIRDAENAAMERAADLFEPKKKRTTFLKIGVCQGLIRSLKHPESA